MFNFLCKEFKIFAPVSGKVIDLSTVSEAIFAEKLMGDGIAIEPTEDVICAPAEGIVRVIFRTNHGFAMSLDNGVELLVHIGLDTVTLQGEYFERITEEGERVELGQPIIRVDSKAIKDIGYNLVTPVLIVNTEKIQDIEYTNLDCVSSGEDVVITYKMK